MTIYTTRHIPIRCVRTAPPHTFQDDASAHEPHTHTHTRATLPPRARPGIYNTGALLFHLLLVHPTNAVAAVATGQITPRATVPFQLCRPSPRASRDTAFRFRSEPCVCARVSPHLSPPVFRLPKICATVLKCHKRGAVPCREIARSSKCDSRLRRRAYMILCGCLMYDK